MFNLALHTQPKLDLYGVHAQHSKSVHLVDVTVNAPGFKGEMDGIMYGPGEEQKPTFSVHPSFLLIRAQ